jgi:hypothetical protein
VFSPLHRWETFSEQISGTNSDSIMCNPPPFYIFRKSSEISGLGGGKKAFAKPPHPYWLRWVNLVFPSKSLVQRNAAGWRCKIHNKRKGSESASFVNVI